MTAPGRPEGEGYQELLLDTERGEVAVRFHDVPGARAAVLMAGGVGGGFDTPAHRLYPRLAWALRSGGIAAVHLCYRDPRNLEEAVYDVLAGVTFLEGRGVGHVGLVGHSFGGAVMIAAGVLSPRVTTVVGLASQSYGTGAVAQLAPKALLLLHGTADTILPAACSLSIHQRAGEPKRLELMPGAGHGLDEAAEPVFALTHEWLLRTLVPSGAVG